MKLSASADTFLLTVNVDIYVYRVLWTLEAEIKKLNSVCQFAHHLLHLISDPSLHVFFQLAEPRRR